MAGRKLVVEFIGDTSSLEKSFGKASQQTNSFGKSIGRLGKAAALTAGGAALGGLFVTLNRGIGEFKEGQQVAAQTTAALKSTGKAAGVTAKHVGNLAQSISNYSGIDDEAVQAGENMLLTFTNIRNEVGKGNNIFDKATVAVADLATKMNNGAIPSSEQLAKSSILVGKALNDPVKGVGALSRVGVTFTKQQKDTIKALVKGGKTAAAQKVILKELNKEFGGSAKAAGSTFSGAIAKLSNKFDGFAGNLVGKALPAVQDLLDIFSGSGSASQKFQKALERIGLSSETSKRIIDDLKETFNTLKTVVVTTFNIIRPILGAFWTQVKGIVQLLDDLIHGRWSKLWGDAVQIVRNTVKLWKTILTTGIKTLGGVALRIGKAIAGGIAQGLSGLGDWIVAKLVAGINAIIRKVNALPGVNIPEIGKGGGGGSKPIGKRAAGAAGPNVFGIGGGPSHPVTGPPTKGFGVSGVSPRIGFSTAGVGAGARGVGAGMVLNGPITVVANDPQAFINGLQKYARRGSASRSGPYGGFRLGLS